MATFEAYVTVGDFSIAVSAVGSPIAVQSQEADVTRPHAVLMVFVPYPAKGTTAQPPSVVMDNHLRS